VLASGLESAPDRQRTDRGAAALIVGSGSLGYARARAVQGPNHAESKTSGNSIWRDRGPGDLTRLSVERSLPVNHERDSRLLRAAIPVVNLLAADLSCTEVSMALAGEGCRVVDVRVPGPSEELQLQQLVLSQVDLWNMDRMSGNGLTAAFASGEPTLVQGGEHFFGAPSRLATAGAPIRDPVTARTVGALALVCSVETASQLLLPLVSQATREIERGLLNDSSGFDHLVHANFLDARRSTRKPLAAVSPTTLLRNAAAARLLPAADRARLWSFLSRDLNLPPAIRPAFTLTDGCLVDVSFKAIQDNGEMVGALVYFGSSTRPQRASGHRSRAEHLSPPVGWESLTAPELSVAELVADGLTNREAASRLFLSPYTVDSHLRRIFRKLNLNSRVDLMRLVMSREAGHSVPSAADVA
jgi:DNA-binding CsgD family transcriptional regulator